MDVRGESRVWMCEVSAGWMSVVAVVVDKRRCRKKEAASPLSKAILVFLFFFCFSIDI